jgi:hypothetical protein
VCGGGSQSAEPPLQRREGEDESHIVGLLVGALYCEMIVACREDEIGRLERTPGMVI